jgi:hypothetical protein
VLLYLIEAAVLDAGELEARNGNVLRLKSFANGVQSVEVWRATCFLFCPRKLSAFS